MSSESGTDEKGDTLELAYSYKVMESTLKDAMRTRNDQSNERRKRSS